MKLPSPPKHLDTFRDRKWREEVTRLINSGTGGGGTPPDLSGLVPYSGATANLNLGTFDILAAEATLSTLNAVTGNITNVVATTIDADSADLSTATIDSLSIGRGAGGVITFDGSTDITLDWDGSTFDIAIATANILSIEATGVSIGAAGAGKNVSLYATAASSGIFWKPNAASSSLWCDIQLNPARTKHIGVTLNDTTGSSGNPEYVGINITETFTENSSIGILFPFSYTDNRTVNNTGLFDYRRIFDLKPTHSGTNNHAAAQTQVIHTELKDTGSYALAGGGAGVANHQIKTLATDLTLTPVLNANVGTHTYYYYEHLVGGTLAPSVGASATGTTHNGVVSFFDIQATLQSFHFPPAIYALNALTIKGYSYNPTVNSAGTVIVEHGFHATRSGLTLAANGNATASDYSTGVIRLGANAERVYSDGTDLVLLPQTNVRIAGHLKIDDAKNVILGTTTGTKFGTATTQKLGFYNVAPVVQQAALTAQLTTITHTAPAAADYAIATLVNSATGSVWGFTTADEGHTVLSVIANLQTRVSQLETRLKSYGFLP